MNLFKYIGAWASQVGGKHYKEQEIQTMHFSMANKLNSLEHSIVKYTLRRKHKDIDIDIDKAIQCLEMLRQYRKGEVFEVESEVQKVESEPLPLNKSCSNCRLGNVGSCKMCNECGENYINFVPKS